MSDQGSGSKSNTDPQASSITHRSMRKLLCNFVIELIIYGGLVTFYYLLVLRFLSTPLVILYNRYIILYAVIALILIVMQGVALESITNFLLSKIGLDFHE